MNISSKLTSSFLTATPAEAAPVDGGVAASPSTKKPTAASINQRDTFDTTAAPSTFQKVAGVIADGPTIAAAALIYGAKSAWDLLSPAASPSRTVTATPAPKESVKPSMPELKKGVKGNDVMLLQNALREAGVKVAHDGDFGGKTEAVVRQFQKAQRPPLKDTGTVDAATWDALKKAAPKSFAAPAAKIETPKVAAPATRTPDGTPIYKQTDTRWGKTLLGRRSWA